MAKDPTCEELEARIRLLEHQLVQFADFKKKFSELEEKYKVAISKG